jgi:hypothetical protein
MYDAPDGFEPSVLLAAATAAATNGDVGRVLQRHGLSGPGGGMGTPQLTLRQYGSGPLK